MMKTKHVPATLDMLRLGQVIELDSGSEGWVRKEILTSNDLIGNIRAFRQFPDKFRVPLITHEDIIELGWVEEDEDEYSLGFWSMEFYKARGVFTICILGMEEYEYAIQTRLDLMDIMRLLGITS